MCGKSVSITSKEIRSFKLFLAPQFDPNGLCLCRAKNSDPPWFAIFYPPCVQTEVFPDFGKFTPEFFVLNPAPTFLSLFCMMTLNAYSRIQSRPTHRVLISQIRLAQISIKSARRKTRRLFHRYVQHVTTPRSFSSKLYLNRVFEKLHKNQRILFI